MKQIYQTIHISGENHSPKRRQSTALSIVLLLAFLWILPSPASTQFRVPAIPSNSQLSAEYEFDAEYIYRVNLEGSYLEDGTIVAYINGELRGAQSASELFPETGEVVYKVRIFSDNASGDTIRFRYYDVFDEKIYEISEHELFAANHVPDYASPEILNALCGEPGTATELLPADGSEEQEATTDLFWQPSENTLRYALYLWKEGETVPTTPYADNLYNTSRRVSNLDHGVTYHWFILSVNQCLQDTSVTQSFTVRELPDLVVTAMSAPDTVVSATPFQLDYSVTNQGNGAIKGVSWNDGFYASTDNIFSSDDQYLGQLSHSLPIPPDSSYSAEATLNLPADYNGTYYLFALTDRSNRIAETDNDNVSQPLEIEVNEKPLPDVEVGNITADRVNYEPGDSIDVSWTVSNTGDAVAAGGWTEKVSIVSLSGIRVNLQGSPQYTGTLENGQEINREYSFVIPDVISFSGEAYAEVKLVPSDELEEYPGDDANNNAASASRIAIRNKLYLEIPDEASEDYTGNLRCYITRSGNYAQPLTVDLSAGVTGEVDMPTSVTIPERSSSAVFNISMVDNATLDGPRKVDITASATGFDPAVDTLNILDDEKPTLTLALDRNNASEGDTLTLTVSRDLVTPDSVIAYLSTDLSSQWTFPDQVVIKGDASSAETSVFVTDDQTPEPDQEVTINGRADGMLSGSLTATILDDDIPGIEMEILTDSISEGAGPYATFGVIRRTGDNMGPVQVNLSADIDDVLFFPSSVSLPEGAMERQFNIGAVDNELVDGFRTVKLSGGIYLSSCNCTTTPENGGAINETITVIDNDGPSLTVTASPVSLREGLADAGTMTIFRNTETDDALDLQLSSSDTSELTVPATATIPAGESTLDVTITTIDDGDDDGNQTVTLKATAENFSPGVSWVNVTDINRPDLEMGDLELNNTEVVAGRQMEIRTTIFNNGYGKAPYGVPVRFYLSENERIDNSDSIIFEGTLDGQIAIGGTFDLVEQVNIPRMTGDYNLLGKINPDAEVTELLYTNNEAAPVALTLNPAYTGTATVDEESFNDPVPVTIHGQAEMINGDPTANADLNVYVIKGNNRRVIEVTTDENGDYSTEFEPFSYESGHYIVGACYPGQGLTDEQDAFDILGMERATKDYLTWDLKKEDLKTGTIGIRNRSNVPLTNVTFEPLEVPDGFNLQIDTIPELPGMQVENFNFTIWGTVVTEGKNYIEVPVRVSSDEGISFEFKAYYYCQALGSHLTSVPASINTSMTKGKTRYYDIKIINDGAGETEQVTIDLPDDQQWMSLASPDTIENITSGDTITATLMFTPNGDIPLNTPLSGRIVVHNSNGDDLAIPYRTEVVSEEKGILRVDVVDEYSYFTDDAPHVQNAHVVVRHPYSGQIVAEGFTDADGIFVTDSLNEGSYRMTVEADKHEGYQNVIVIDPGRVNEQTVFLSFQAISYTWEVVPTEIEDEYEVELVLEYETNVPAPVVVMEMPKSMPQLFNDETYTFLVTLTNEGLITAEDVELAFPEDDPEYEWVTDYQVIDLLAQQSIQIPVTMQRKDSPSSAGTLKSGNNGGGGCSDYAMTFYGFECGSDRQWKQTNALFTIEGRSCPGDGGGGSSSPPSGDGGGGPGGAGGGSSTSYDSYGGSASTVSPSTGCDPCLISTLQTILGCVGPPVGEVLACGYGFADGDASLSDIGGCIPKIGCPIGVIATIETCYNTPPFGPWGGGSASGVSRLKSTSSSVPPIMLQAATEMDWAAYGGQAERDYMSEYMGNIDWSAKENFIDLTIEADSIVTNKVPFDTANATRLREAMEGTDFTQSEVDYFITRWNQSLEAWDAGVTAPNDQYNNIISQDSLDVYFGRMQEARDYALDLGYMSVSDMRYQAWHTLKDETEDRRSSVCASVSIKISQKLVMTREAFEGTLTIFNGNTTTAMEEVELNLEIRNQNGELANDLFEIETKALDILTGVDGNGSLGPEEKGSATILFIPEKGAAPEVPVSYSFGGSFSYLDPFTGTTVEKPLFPVTLDVNPSPDLFLHYFMQRDILGDDPLTEPIEPIIPGELAVMIENNGFGTAKNVRIESAQPEIVDNEKGLAIHFELIGSNLNGKPTQLGLTDIDFGNIDPKSTKIGQWWFTADLLGHFVNYEANITHLDSRGNPDLSLVSGVELHELIRSIRVYGDTDDGINDFLVNEYQDAEERPDAIYLSQGDQVEDVHAADLGYFEGSIQSPEFTNTLKVRNSKLGWNYVRLDDPGNGRYELISITRVSDNQEIPIDNGWLTHVTLPDGNEPVYEDKFHFVDQFEDFTEQEYLITWKLKDPNPPEIMRIDGAPDAFVSQPVNNVTVKFNKEVDPATFTWEDMMLRLQGGDDIMDSTVVITQMDSVTYEIDLSQLTTGNGFYVLTVQAAGIQDIEGTNGETGKQVSWTQFLDVPVVEEFTGIPKGVTDTTFDYALVKFNLPIDVNTLSSEQFMIQKDGSDVPGNLQVTQMDTDAELFKITGLEAMMDGEGSYSMIVDLTAISTIDGKTGLEEQSVDWSIDTTPPTILSFTSNTEGGFDEQHVTSVDILFSESVSGFGLNSVELWHDDTQQPLSQTHIDSTGLQTRQMSQFRLLTYHAGDYTLKVHMNTVFDKGGITGDSIATFSWSVDRTAPPAVENLSITPDRGYSDTDGITSTRELNLLMDVPMDGVNIEIYKNDFGTLTLLADSGNVSAGPLAVPMTVTSPGNVLLEVHTVGEGEAFSITQLPIVIDESAFRAQFQDVPADPVTEHPQQVRVKFTERILAGSLDMNSFSLKLNGNPVDLSVLSITQLTDTTYALSGLNNLENKQGTYKLTLDLSNVEKYSSGLRGSYTASSEWTIRKTNMAPVADAGEDFTMVPGTQYQLDASGSYDPESDQLTIEWLPPEGITLDNPFSMTPTFTAPDAKDGTEYTFTLSLSDGEFTVNDEVTALLLDNTTDINDLFTNGSISIYPNPTKGAFKVSVGNLKVETIRLLDMNGKVMMNRNWNGEQEMNINLQHVPNGIYIIMVGTKDKMIIGRIVKE